MLKSMIAALGRNDVTAYLTMMAPRLLELRRVLKPTGALYLHCDPTASHYLKALLDAIFGPQNFRNEIIWKRTSAHNDPKRYGSVHDTIFFYGKSASLAKWNPQHTRAEGYYNSHDFGVDDVGRRFRLRDVTAPDHGSTTNNLRYTWKGVDAPAGRT